MNGRRGPGDTLIVVGARDAETIERDRGLATADTVWIRITATPGSGWQIPFAAGC